MANVVLLCIVLKLFLQDVWVTEADLYPESDFIAVIPTCEGREEIISGSRAWRQGIRTFIATNASRHLPSFKKDNQTVESKDGETYRCILDEKYTSGVRFHGARPGDLRSAISPFLAHAHYSNKSETYKWMLYGDDDTVFFIPNVISFLGRLNHMVPYALTDNLWYRRRGSNSPYHPHPDAPRCYPCALPEHSSGQPNQGSIPAEAVSNSDPYSILGYTPPTVCEACTVDVACKAYREANMDCDAPRAHGGAGIIFSKALLDFVDLNEFQRCLERVWGASGSDTLISLCLWEAGYAFTDPGVWIQGPGHPHEGRPHPHYIIFDNRRQSTALRADHFQMMKSKTCSGSCAYDKWLLKSMVSMHVAARAHPTSAAAGHALNKTLSSYYRAMQLAS
ncbi:hypothetical protein CEUSTIGMA_g9525.t1 [Chlamydomonas eustigma]|uniref:Hexosyltransferase n=1 Tax=Chlamydomonas eustigma TaxID=1157962 RepID=A0A250XG94_9CHLO|nr:hypothetical protein CEUSTIGMA_g9525.t1 [Chlamydomonas eustigma]|eukprot:GAX82097.1 hypothetical protein CEUSTIGMA_g9525.t1 [Chlamydomonas eustigma]